MDADFQSDIVILQLCDVIDRLRDEMLRKTATSSQAVERILDLTMRQGKAMIAVSVLTMRQPKGISLKKLAARIGMTLPATSLLVDGMVNGGYLVREPDPDDRRALCIQLSPEGREGFQRICEAARESTADLFDGVSDEEKRVFSNVVSRIYRRLFPES